MLVSSGGTLLILRKSKKFFCKFFLTFYQDESTEKKIDKGFPHLLNQRIEAITDKRIEFSNTQINKRMIDNALIFNIFFFCPSRFGFLCQDMNL